MATLPTLDVISTAKTQLSNAALPGTLGCLGLDGSDDLVQKSTASIALEEKVEMIIERIRIIMTNRRLRLEGEAGGGYDCNMERMVSTSC